MGHTPAPIPRLNAVRPLVLSDETLRANWYKHEAEREVEAMFSGESYTYREFDRKEAIQAYNSMCESLPRRGPTIQPPPNPPRGGSSVVSPERLTYANYAEMREFLRSAEGQGNITT